MAGAEVAIGRHFVKYWHLLSHVETNRNCQRSDSLLRLCSRCSITISRTKSSILPTCSRLLKLALVLFLSTVAIEVPHAIVWYFSQP